MTSETAEKKHLTSYWLSFIENTGKIVGISKRKPRDISDEHKLVNIIGNSEARKISRGDVNLKDYAISWSVLSNSWDLTRKKNHIELQPLRRELKEIPATDTPNEDEIHFSIYKKDMKAVVSINRTKIAATHNISKLNRIVHNEWNLMNIFVCKKDDPDSLITIIPIDALFLFKHKKMIIDLPQIILRSTDIDNISLFTIPLFNEYGLSYYEDYVATPNEAGLNKIINSNLYNDKGQINIHVVNDNTLNFKQNLQGADFNTFDARNIFRILVCDTVYDNLIGGVDIPVGDLLSETSIDVELPFNIPETPLFLYKNNNITISYNGELT